MAKLPKDQSRLIDHFKRAYSIIVGLALTEACKRLLLDTHHFHASALWMFLTLFVTIVPIFQGGDRFLDVTYMHRDLSPRRARISFMWDVYMLLVTALIFVGVAETIPATNDPTPATHADFFYGLSILFAFDAFVLLVGYLKSTPDERGKIGTNYGAWQGLNVLMAALSLIVALHLDDRIAWVALPLSVLAFIVLGAAIIRTGIDYLIDKDFMFPKIQAAAEPEGC